MTAKTYTNPRVGKWTYDTRYTLEHFTFYCLSANVSQNDFRFIVRRGSVVVSKGVGDNLVDAKQRAIDCMKSEWAKMGESLNRIETSSKNTRAWKSKIIGENHA